MVVDPAIGSGAFLVGMMMEIIKARGVLTKLFPKEEQFERTAYNFKRECIENNLYGVDIDPGAVDIAQLRLWLSLVVDEEDIHKIKPLPNLDYKIMCGNSLLDEFEGVKLFDERLLGEIKTEDYSEEIRKIEKDIGKLYEELGMITTGKKKDYGISNGIKREIDKLKKKKQKLMATPQKEGVYGSLFEAQIIKGSQKKLKQLQALHKQFFNEHNRRNKIELRAEIEKRDWEFIEETLKEQGNESAKKKLEQIKKTRSKPFFLWKLYFSDVFQENGGFDIIIGNPPYDVIYSNNRPEEYAYYKKTYSSAEYNPNLFALFIERGISLLKPKGILGFINPDTLLTNKYFGSLRRKIITEASILNILDLSSGVFASAIVDTIIIIIAKTCVKDNKITVGYDIESRENLIGQSFRTKEISQNEFEKSNNNEFNIYFSSDLYVIKEKMLKDSILLGNISNIKRGIVTKDNKKFIFNHSNKNKCGDKSKLKRLLVGKDATRYHLKYSGNYILFDKKAIGGGCWDSKIYEAKEKILIALITGGMEYRINATYDNKQFYTLQNYNNLLITDGNFNIKYVLALLNSKLINDYYRLFFNDKNIKRVQLQQLPIKEASKNKQLELAELAKEYIVLSKDFEDSSKGIERNQLKEELETLNRRIDHIVYRLYNITEEEQKLIEANLKEN
jgi:hypothetical protein